MSETRKSLNTLTQTQLNARDERLDKANTLDDRGMILSDFGIWLDGALDVAKALGVSEDDSRGLRASKSANDAELNLLEQKVVLAQALADN